jgi:hypothetical protein
VLFDLVAGDLVELVGVEGCRDADAPVAPAAVDLGHRQERFAGQRVVGGQPALGAGSQHEPAGAAACLGDPVGVGDAQQRPCVGRVVPDGLHPQAPGEVVRAVPRRPQGPPVGVLVTYGGIGQ